MIHLVLAFGILSAVGVVGCTALMVAGVVLREFSSRPLVPF